MPEVKSHEGGIQNAISTENPQETRLNSSTTAFTPPPPERHISEGSFFISDDRLIHQVVDGQGVPVVYGGSQLWAGGAMFGRRMGSLIGLRDLARRVLQSQNEGWPEQHRNDARRQLNWAYERFTSAYGPINKTTFSETKDGTVIRRMPNLAKFREDPDAMLVMSLEEYDEATGKATKAAIMQRDVVGKKPPVTSVTSAEEGLLVSLDQRGGVDIPFISQLYGKPDEQVIAELGDLIYRDPESKQWQTADAYLSGNVRSKLTQAEAAGPEYQRNADALRAVQPEDVLPGDIDANLGAPWIPESDIQAFAAHLFQVDPATIQVAHLAKDAVWSIDCGYQAQQSVAATADFGTPRANGTALLEKALNLQSPTVYDPDPMDSDKRVVNQEQTLAAREKQKVIKEKFKAWVFTDPDRTERLVRLYNDTYNNLRPRLFDGSHLEFPGMNQAITLKPHQVNAVWRCMTAGNTLLAHVVGAGKSFEMAASAMKMKQTGLVSKPLIVVPNHLLEQFAREFQQLYPNAKLLVASKEDFTKEHRKHLTAKIATGDWDAIIVTHSSFERIGMSREYQEKFLREQIEEYEELLCDSSSKGCQRAKRNLIKTIEKQKAAREEKLKDLLAGDKKDDGLVFDELGIDHIFIDEAQYFKNLETPTKMDARSRRADRRERASLRPVHEVPLPPRAAPRPRRHLRNRHADQQQPRRDVHDAAVPRSRWPAEPRHRPFRRLGRQLRRSGRQHGDFAGRQDAEATQPLRPLREPARVAADVPGLRRRADGRHAGPSPSQAGRRQTAHRRLPHVGGAAGCPAAPGRARMSGYAMAGSIRATTTPLPSPPTVGNSPSMRGCYRLRREITQTRKSTRWWVMSTESGSARHQRDPRR